MFTSTTDATISGHPRREDDAVMLARFVVADALKDSVAELRKDDEMRMSQHVYTKTPSEWHALTWRCHMFTTTFQEEFSAIREREERGIARLEKAITDLKPPTTDNDPTTTFWTVDKKVADEHDNDLLSKYARDLNTSLIFADLFSAVTTTFIVQITSSIPTGVVRARFILFASLSVTLFVAFIAAFGKQWILYYIRVTTLEGGTIDRGKERRVKLAGLGDGGCVWF